MSFDWQQIGHATRQWAKMVVDSGWKDPWEDSESNESQDRPKIVVDVVVVVDVGEFHQSLLVVPVISSSRV